MSKPELPLQTRVRSSLLRTWWCSQNRWCDLRAILAGYCNHSPWKPEPDKGGGYSHWRCALRRRHGGLHRARNYVWDDSGKTEFMPMRGSYIGQPWDGQRNMTMTRRQARAQERWTQQELAKIRARRSM